MRLRLTVKRNQLPDTSILWPVDKTSSPSVYQLLEQVNELIPITTDDEWDLNDYAVEIKGTNGVNYECLHYLPVCKVMKDEDEVIIRPLLSHDLKSRRVSGRHQISTNGMHLVDGVPFGRPLLKRPRGRPAIKIHPRKRPKLLEEHNDGEGGDENEQEGEEEEEEPKAIEDTPNTDRQMILHGDFNDEDSEDDEDFAPGDEEDEDSDEPSEDEISDADSNDEEDRRMQAERDEQEDADTIPIPVQAALADVHDPAHRAKIRKLHASFPTAEMALCRYVLQGAGYDLVKGWEALSLQYKAESPKSAMTETSEGKSKTLPAPAPEATPDEDLDEEGSSEEEEDSVVKHYDQHGLSPGSIQSGKALSFMAAAVKSSDAGPSRLQSTASNKRLKFAEDGLSNGFTSTPAIDKGSQVVDSSSSEDSNSSSSSDEDGDEENEAEADVQVSSVEPDDSSDDASITSSDSSSDDSSEEEDIDVKGGSIEKTAIVLSDDDTSDDSSVDSSDDGSDVEMKNTKVLVDEDAESSESDLDSSSSDDSSSDDEAPEVSSSRLDTSVSESTSANSTRTSGALRKEKAPGSPGRAIQGKTATKHRNTRRRNHNLRERYSKKGILPAGITTAELTQLKLDDDASLEEAEAKLTEIRAQNATDQDMIPTSHQGEDFERARALLLESLASGGVDVNLVRQSRSRSNSARPFANEASPAADVSISEISDSQPAVNTAFSKQGTTEPAEAVTSDAGNVEGARPSTAPETSTPGTSLTSPKPTPASAEPIKDATRPRRSRLDLGAGKRLLFGALGIKTPKTKADEEKVKSDLMKYARPLKVTQITNEETALEESANDEDPEAWRQKINYRAVECVDGGLLLSEPPFPFKQRWDSQQQRGAGGGKRKQAQRDQPQYYEDTRASKKQKQRKGKHSYAEEQEYLDASYDPSYQEETGLQYDDTMHMGDSPTTSVQNEVSQQLVSEAPTPADSAQSPEDLAELPQDISTLRDLKDGEARVGMTIAFKLMEMVNYNPVITKYRTAIVIALQENGSLQLSLAMRDQQRKVKKYNENGERIYGKFEAAEDSDDEMEDEDDGMLFKEYSELFDPKIVQQPPAKYGAEEDSQPGETQPEDNGDDDGNDDGNDSQDRSGERSEESKTVSHEETSTQPEQFSHVTETSLNSDAPERQQGETHQDGQVDGQVVESADQEPERQTEDKSVHEQISESLQKSLERQSEDLVANEMIRDSVPEDEQDEQLINDSTLELPDAATPRPTTPAREISDDSRKEISTIMRDAGFRSSIPSVLRDIRPENMQSPAEVAAFEKLRKEMLQTPAAVHSQKSPSFQRPDPSSPLRKRKSVSVSPAKPQVNSKSSPLQATQNSWETVDSEYGTPSPEMPQDEPEKEAPSSGWVTEGQSGYPSSPPAREGPMTDHIEDEQPQDDDELTNVDLENDGTSGPLGVGQGEPAPFNEVATPAPMDETVESVEAKDLPDPEVEELVKKVQRAKKLPKKVPTSHAQAAWEMFRPTVRKTSTRSVLSDEDEPSLWVDGPAGKESNPSVLYPKLSGGSSFTSQITDYGRQPELQYDDSTIGGGGNNFETGDVDMDGPSINLDDTVIVQDTPALNPSVVEAESDSDDNFVDIEEDPAKSPERSMAREHMTKGPTYSNDASSDGDFPSLEALSQQARTIKHEPSQPDILNTLERRLGRKKSTPISNMDGNNSDESSQSTPKASQKQRHVSDIRKIKKEHASQPQWHSSQPRASQPPQKSQVVDLTLSSDESDAEQIIKPTSFKKKSYKDESAKFRRSSSDKVEPVKATKPKKLAPFSLSDGEDDLFDEASTGGWKPKKKNMVGGVDARRHTGSGAGLKVASDANRRKTFAR